MAESFRGEKNIKEHGLTYTKVKWIKLNYFYNSQRSIWTRVVCMCWPGTLQTSPNQTKWNWFSWERTPGKRSHCLRYIQAMLLPANPIWSPITQRGTTLTHTFNMIWRRFITFYCRQAVRRCGHCVEERPGNHSHAKSVKRMKTAAQWSGIPRCVVADHWHPTFLGEMLTRQTTVWAELAPNCMWALLWLRSVFCACTAVTGNGGSECHFTPFCCFSLDSFGPNTAQRNARTERVISIFPEGILLGHIYPIRMLNDGWVHLCLYEAPFP